MNSMKKRLVGGIVGIVGLAAVGSAGVALAANGDRVPTPSSGRTPVVSTGDRHGQDGPGVSEAGDDRGHHTSQSGPNSGSSGDQGTSGEQGDDSGHDGQHEQADDHGHDGHQGDHGDDSGPGSVN
jgi:hypothetical protein